MKIEIVCKKCGCPAPKDEEKSTANWTVYKNKCDRCGGKVGPSID